MDFSLSPPAANWYLGAVADLDVQFYPGLLAKLLQSSLHRRHVVAAILCTRLKSYDNRSELNGPEAAAQLISGRLAGLVQKFFGETPRGFLGALSRMGPDIEPPDFYRRLFDLYSDPSKHEVVRALRHVRGVNPQMLDIVIDAPAILLRSGGWQMVCGPHQRDDLFGAIQTIKEVCGVDDAEISRSLSKARDHGSVFKFIRGWLSRANFPAAPDIHHPMIRPIRNAADLRRTAIKFENCLDGFLLDILHGKDAFYIVDSPVFGPMVARIGREYIDAPWLLLGIHLKANRAPSYAASEWVDHQFAAAGVRRQHVRRALSKRWAVIERLLDPVLHDLDDLLAD